MTTFVTKMFRVTALASAMMVGPVVLSQLPQTSVAGFSAVAQEEEEQETRRVPAMSPRVGRYFEPVLEVFELENPTTADYQEALELLQSYDIERWNGYEKAMFWRYQAGLYATMEDYSNAKRCYVEMLDYRTDVQPRMEQETLLMLSKLEGMDENWDGALGFLDQWWQLIPAPTMDGYKLRGTFKYQKQDFRGALADMKVVVADAEEKQGKAKEGDYNMQFGIYSELGQPNEMLRVAEVMVRHYPSAITWKRLYSMYIDRDRIPEALAAMQVCYDQGYFDRESQISTFAGLWNAESNPYLAGKYFQEGIDAGIVEANQKNFEFLANWWYQAREYKKSIDARRKAAELSDDGENWSQLARAQLQESMYEETVASSRKAIQGGGLRDVAATYILQGQAYIALKRFEDAKTSFERASNSSGASQRYASQFIAFVQQKIDLLASLES
jgi:tetratricopeptide (TPR) repeat protein